MKTKFKQQDAVTVVEFSGNVMGGPEFEPLHEEVKSRIADGARRFLFDFGGVKWINSTGVGIMVTMFTTIKAADGVMAISRPNERVRGTYMISQVSTLFDTYESIDEGVAGLS
ncbi:MAG TPA: STAS domain-containing protein [Candidatus Krumholzibacteria bacterium]|nr:STAS domain-containing protein [Candidatus Krumholzibacteria bacterium]HRX50646.1 STAS domain-containing protein [Candidatus Krumholzibacteria bacterium]